MTDKPVIFHGDATQCGEANIESARPEISRLHPKVNYGLRVALLAGVISATGCITTGLGNPANILAGPMDTTSSGVTQMVRQPLSPGKLVLDSPVVARRPTGGRR